MPPDEASIFHELKMVSALPRKLQFQLARIIAGVSRDDCEEMQLKPATRINMLAYLGFDYEGDNIDSEFNRFFTSLSEWVAELLLIASYSLCPLPAPSSLASR